MNRMEAVEKLVDEFHLNIEERIAFLESPLQQKEVVAGIERIISQKGCYPSSWNSEIGFEGVYLERNEDKYVATYKAEESFAKYSIIEIREFENETEAAKYAYEKMFRGEIDGIEVK